jgi:hypothetical protein
MSTNVKGTGTQAAKPGSDYMQRYIRLRTILDSLESTGLRYCLAGESENERIKRAKKIEALVMPVIKEIAKLSAPKPKKSKKSANIVAFSNPGQVCPEGYCNCNGVCVPYDCPG